MSAEEEHSQAIPIEIGLECTNITHSEEVVNVPNDEASQCVHTEGEHIPPPPEESQYERVVTASVVDEIEVAPVVETEPLPNETAVQASQSEE
jgi:hypothetical protein